MKTIWRDFIAQTVLASTTKSLPAAAVPDSSITKAPARAAARPRPVHTTGGVTVAPSPGPTGTPHQITADPPTGFPEHLTTPLRSAGAVVVKNMTASLEVRHRRALRGQLADPRDSAGRHHHRDAGHRRPGR